jgi:hypothetical protein
MIRHAVGAEPLPSRAGAGWLKRAKARTTKFVKAGSYSEKSSIWSEVKPIFMRIQHNKCAFCERQLEGPEYGAIEHDLEHFRPKSSVELWPGANHARGLAYDFATGVAGGGYYWLAYDLGNYAAACKTCNSPLKSNYFPVGGARGSYPADFAALAAEMPLLCLPIGEGDTNPEELVTFVATTAIPTAKEGFNRRRGQVIIDFFDLNGREQLHRDRARMLLLLYYALEGVLTTKGAEKAIEESIVKRVTSPDSPHTGCCRAFKRTWETDRDLGRRIGDACKSYVASIAGTAPPKI